MKKVLDYCDKIVDIGISYINKVKNWRLKMIKLVKQYDQYTTGSLKQAVKKWNNTMNKLGMDFIILDFNLFNLKLQKDCGFVWVFEAFEGGYYIYLNIYSNYQL
ncbi:hypothetical protein MEO40_17755 [Dolichospermum sp. ST_sed1]|nr:hypothetical protein [Dolichospermum sp. ST_sed1]